MLHVYTMQTTIILLVVIWHTVQGFTCTTQGTSSNPDDVTCQTYVFCAQLPSGTFISNVYSCATGNLFNPATLSCDPNYVCSSVTAGPTEITTTSTQDDIVCTAQGRFPNTTDTTCSSYYFCYYLLSDQYFALGFTCPQGSRFDPTSQSCSQTYDCGQSSISTDATTTGTTFQCSAQGRFPVEDDPTCSTYYFCYYLTSGQYYLRNYSCPQGYKFDPAFQTCSNTYQCGGNTTQTTDAAVTSTSFQCTTQGRFSVETDTTCTSYYYCLLLSTGRYVQYTYTCPNSTAFDPILQSCSSTYACSSSSVDTSTSSVPTNAPSLRALSTRCIAQGRFRVTTDSTCRSYYNCIRIINGTYIEYSYLCPSGTRFDETSQTCSTTYNCESAITTVNSSSPASNPTFACSSQGRFSMVDDITCRSYYYCVLLTNGSYIYQQYRCPTGTYFNPDNQSCNASYQCPSPTTVSSGPSLRKFENEESQEFKCVSTGKFPAPQNRFCQNYYYCFVLPNGKFAKQLYTCESGENFDAKLQECSRNYQCPIEIKSEIALQLQYKCTTVGKFEVEDDPTCQKYYYCISFPNGEFDYQLYSCSSGETFHPKQQTCSKSYQCPYFECTSAGKFPAREDPTCQTYHYCFSLSNGLFGKQLFACSAGETFDPKLQICSKTYQCLPK